MIASTFWPRCIALWVSKTQSIREPTTVRTTFWQLFVGFPNCFCQSKSHRLHVHWLVRTWFPPRLTWFLISLATRNQHKDRAAAFRRAWHHAAVVVIAFPTREGDSKPLLNLLDLFPLSRVRKLASVNLCMQDIPIRATTHKKDWFHTSDANASTNAGKNAREIARRKRERKEWRIVYFLATGWRVQMRAQTQATEPWLVFILEKNFNCVCISHDVPPGSVVRILRLHLHRTCEPGLNLFVCISVLS